MGDVGGEVAADRLEAADAGHVVDDDEQADRPALKVAHRLGVGQEVAGRIGAERQGGRSLLRRGHRGLPKGDLAGLARALVAFSGLAGQKDILEADANPVMVTADGVVAVDALIVTGG